MFHFGVQSYNNFLTYANKMQEKSKKSAFLAAIIVVNVQRCMQERIRAVAKSCATFVERGVAKKAQKATEK